MVASSAFLFVQLSSNRVDEIDIELGERVQIELGRAGRPIRFGCSTWRNDQILFQLLGQLVLFVLDELGGVERDLKEFVGQDVARRGQLVQYFQDLFDRTKRLKNVNKYQRRELKKRANLNGIGRWEFVCKSASFLVVLDSLASTSFWHALTLFAILLTKVILNQQLVQLEQENVRIVVVVLERLEHTVTCHKLCQEVQRVEFAREPFLQRLLLAENAHGQIDRLEYAIGRISARWLVAFCRRLDTWIVRPQNHEQVVVEVQFQQDDQRVQYQVRIVLADDQCQLTTHLLVFVLIIKQS